VAAGEIVNYRNNLVLRLSKYVIAATVFDADSSFHCSAVNVKDTRAKDAARSERKIKGRRLSVWTVCYGFCSLDDERT